MSAIPTPTHAPKQRLRIVRFEISSLDQSVKKLDTSHFRWRFPFAIKEIVEMSLIAGTIPAPVTNIDATSLSSWNSFTFRLGSLKLTITIPPGLYTPTTITHTLQELLNQAASVASSPNTFEVSLYPNTERLQVTRTAGSDSFGFLFGTGSYTDSIDKTSGTIQRIGSPALIFGFIPGINEMDVNGVIVTPNEIDLGLLTNRIYLYLNYDSTQNLQAYSRGMGRSSPSAIIPMDELRDGRKFLNKESYNPLIVTKNAPMGRIETLDIQFQDFFGNPVNFGGREVSLILEASCS
jgi:hypothetical protein